MLAVLGMNTTSPDLAFFRRSQQLILGGHNIFYPGICLGDDPGVSRPATNRIAGRV